MTRCDTGPVVWGRVLVGMARGALDKETAGALLDLFWVKGASPTDSPTD